MYVDVFSQHIQAFLMPYWIVSHRHMAKRMDGKRKKRARKKMLTVQGNLNLINWINNIKIHIQPYIYLKYMWADNDRNGNRRSHTKALHNFKPFSARHHDKWTS